MERIKSADKFAASSEARQFDPFFYKIDAQHLAVESFIL
jgi:hypothetical protein